MKLKFFSQKVSILYHFRLPPSSSPRIPLPHHDLLITSKKKNISLLPGSTMADLGAHGWVSVAELCIYIPLLLLSLYVCIRQGFYRSSGWVYTFILCLVRVIGPIFQIVARSNPGNTGLIRAAVTLDAIGISPLFLATLGLLSRL